MRVVTGLMGLIGVVIGAGPLAAADGPARRPAATRPAPPTRSPQSLGFVPAATLPDGAVPAADIDGNFVLGPTHPRSADMVPNDAAVPHGTVTTLTLRSTDSAVYAGVARDPQVPNKVDPADPAKLIVASHPAPYTRTVAVYVPAGYRAGVELPFIVGADGPDRSLFTALDHLIATHAVPAMAAISIGNGGGDAQGSERGLEYDALSGRYADFVEREVLPVVESHCHVRLTRDPDGRATTGCSSGGACALTMAWFHPERYHRVLTYSGTFVDQQWPPDPQFPHGAWAYPEHLIVDQPRKPLRIWMEVGDRDLLNPNALRDGMHDWVLANERVAAALAARGYAYQFVFARNAGHCDGGVKQQTLPAALTYLWHDYRPPVPAR